MIWLLRHGADDDTRLGGWSNAGLSPVGIEQVRRASEMISSGDYHIQHVFSSDLPRAKETAETIAEKLGLSVKMLKEFRETNNGDLAGISKSYSITKVILLDMFPRTARFETLVVLDRRNNGQ